MDAIGSGGSPKMESWMVDMLFSQPGQAKPDTPAAASTAAPSVSVTSAARSKVASGDLSFLMSVGIVIRAVQRCLFCLVETDLRQPAVSEVSPLSTRGIPTAAHI